MLVQPSVIFDMDGVLVNSNPAHFDAFRKMGELLGVPFTQSMLEQTFGMHNNQIFPLWLGRDLSSERIVELSRLKEEAYREIARESLRPFQGAVELVTELEGAGFSLAVGSSGPRANVELALQILGLEKHFRNRVTGDDVVHGKPAPDIFLKAAERLQVDPACCLVIEDAPQGVQAAVAAGMTVIAVTTSCNRALLGAADRIVDSLSELGPDEIREIFQKSKNG